MGVRAHHGPRAAGPVPHRRGPRGQPGAVPAVLPGDPQVRVPVRELLPPAEGVPRLRGRQDGRQGASGGGQPGGLLREPVSCW